MLHPKRAAFMRLFFLFGILWAIWITYVPNLNGSFILDDWPNLSPLEQIHTPYNWQELLDFLANNRSGNDNLSRPISLISFAVQASDWPQNPLAFKAVNLVLHLLNGLLIILLSQYLLKVQLPSRLISKWVPLLIGLLWLIQPIHVSTVLYTVQRMTLLATFFSLLSLVGYLKGRELGLNQIKPGYYVSVFSLVVGGLLAVLSKENGVLIVLYIAVIEGTMLQQQPKPQYWQYFIYSFIFIPLGLSVIYLVFNFQSFVVGHNYREYTLTEHLFTESRILVEYLQKILLPRPNAFGLFFDDYKISTGLLSPISTLICTFIIIGLFVSAWVNRVKQPVLAFGILWFFAGHALESTVIPLELYFEHRNYLASLGVIFAVCYYFLFFLNKTSTQRVKWVFVGLGIVYVSGVWFIAYQEASLWGNPTQQAVVWQSAHPQSKRANALASETWLSLNQPLKADSYLQNIPSIDKKDSASYLMRLGIHCYSNHISNEEQAGLLELLKQKKVDNAAVLSIKTLVSNQIAGNCQYLTANYVEQLLKVLLSITSPGRHLSYLASTISLFYAANNEYYLAFKTLDSAIQKMPDATELRLLKIRWAIANKQLNDALNWIAETRNQKNRTFLRGINYKNQLEEMEKDVYEMLKAKTVLK
jgi:hypothetical protein